uniref:Uncharacterized protein n=1 Tax=Sphaerodactylus townsendi TaxID=933632 RepID=A0ACB8G5Q5_9SAUR
MLCGIDHTDDIIKQQGLDRMIDLFILSKSAFVPCSSDAAFISQAAVLAGRTPDLHGILDVIKGAEEFVYVSVMEYFPTSRFRRPPRYWPTKTDNALRET